jgi:asparagine synthase (glutamine-hydrolysing)
MSGIAAAYGSPQQRELEAIIEKIGHRGPCASGIYNHDTVIMAQNYLRADAVTCDSGLLPFRDDNAPNLAICYDGQMGNWADLAADHDVPDGPFREERLLLALYRKYGRDMLDYLHDTIFALVITDGQEILAARDLLGIKTLFYGKKNDTLYLASELKGILEVTSDVHEFPNGHYLDASGEFKRFAALPEKPPPELSDYRIEQMARDIREYIERSFANRIDFSVPTGGLLSGGMDSSVINYIASRHYKEKFGRDARFKTFALGVGESNDIRAARIIARQIDSEHHELIVDIDQLLEVLPEVIYYLENFDPSLVRSSAANYLISRYAYQQGIRILLSGEGGDEVFCGYKYLGTCPTDELFARQMECLGFLHSNASLRLDRMNMSNSVKVVAPLISAELLDYAMTIPPQYKQKPQVDNQRIEKWIFRKAYEDILPSSIVWRSKQEFSQGSGSADALTTYFADSVDDSEFARAQAKYPLLRSKEELYYFNIFTDYYGDGKAVDTVGQWPFL